MNAYLVRTRKDTALPNEIIEASEKITLTRSGVVNDWYICVADKLTSSEGIHVYRPGGGPSTLLLRHIAQKNLADLYRARFLDLSSMDLSRILAVYNLLDKPESLKAIFIHPLNEKYGIDAAGYKLVATPHELGRTELDAFLKAYNLGEHILTGILPYHMVIPREELSKKQLIGVELEFAGTTRNRVAELLARYDSFGRYTNVYSDGSIDVHALGGESVELRVGPTTLDRLDDLHNFVSEIKASGARTNGSCGMHIHVNMIDYPQQFVSNIYRRFLQEESEIMDKFKICNHRRIGYARPINMPNVEVGPVNVVNYMRLGRKTLNAASYAKHGTMEWRVFDGTVEPDKVVEAMNFVWDYCYNTDNLSMYKSEPVLS